MNVPRYTNAQARALFLRVVAIPTYLARIAAARFLSPEQAERWDAEEAAVRRCAAALVLNNRLAVERQPRTPHPAWHYSAWTFWGRWEATHA